MADNQTNVIMAALRAMSAPSVAAPIPGHEKEMKVNRSGVGFCFVKNDKDTAESILILGTGNGYYTTAAENTSEAIGEIARMLADGKGDMLLDLLKDIYDKGRAAKQDPSFMAFALLAHPMTSKDLEFRRKVLEWVTSIRTGSHFLKAISLYQSTGKGGWGRLPKRAFGKWFTVRSPKDLLYQCMKYYNRDGFTIRDVLRLVHIDPKDKTIGHQMVLKLLAGLSNKNKSMTEAFDEALVLGDESFDEATVDLYEYMKAIKATKICAEGDDKVTIPELIEHIYKWRMPREFLPTWCLNNPAIQRSLLLSKDGTQVTMPMTALIRSLNRLTILGLFSDRAVLNLVVAKLTSEEAIRRSRIHPAQLLVAWKQYSAGRGLKGSKTWVPVRELVDALEKAFYISFVNVEPTGLRLWYLIDGSASMSWNGSINVVPNMCATEAAAALAMVSLRTEKIGSVKVKLVSRGIRTIKDVILTPRMGLDEVVRKCHNIGGCTDLSSGIDQAIEFFKSKYSSMGREDKAAFQKALAEKDHAKLAEYHAIFDTPEAFVYYTDSDVNSGRHPMVALKEFRDLTGIPAKLVVFCTQAGNYSILDPKDRGCFLVSGFDTQGPQLVSDFLRRPIPTE